MTLYTIGHSNRSFDDFLALLRAYRIELVADVRHYPGSRKYPHFNRESLAVALPANGIAYRYLLGLGGRRKGRPDSPNDGWEHPAFRSYADYAQTEEFARALDDLVEIADSKRTAIMCSEAVYWRCHRRIIADYLLVRGIEVRHVLTPSRAAEGAMTSFARISEDGSIVYGAAPSASPSP